MSNSTMDSGMRLGLVMIACGLVLTGVLGYYFATITIQPTVSAKTTTASSALVGENLDLVQLMNNEWNSSLAQPRFMVSTPNGLVSSANITVHANTLIRVMIVSYDTPTSNSSAQYGAVSGTVGNYIYLINGSIASMSGMMNAADMQWGQNVTSVPANMIAHTFSIPSLNINMPVVGGDTVIAYLRFTTPGTYQWVCYTPCGFGPGGGMGAMSKTGWMEGQITVT